MNRGFKIFTIKYQKLVYGFNNSIKKVLWSLARDAFLFVLILILVSMVFGELLFYNYALLAETKEIDIVSSITKFQEDTYQSVIQEQKNREDIFNNPPDTNYQSPF